MSWGRSRKCTHEDYLEKFNTLEDHEDYEVIGKYTNIKTKIEYRHKVCGKNFFMTPGNFNNNGQRCPHCNGNFRLTNEEFKKRIYKMHKDEYILLSDYKNNDTKVKLLHKPCGNTIEVRPGDFYRGYTCVYCSGHKRLTLNDIIERVDRIGKYLIENSEYNKKKFKTVHSKLKIKCLKCNRYFYMTYNNLRNGQNCKYCVTYEMSSKVVKNIMDYLDNHKIKYDVEVRLKGLKSKSGKYLKMDFYLPDLDIFIEYDGMHHYRYNDKGRNTRRRYLKIKKYDKMKDDYCEKYGLTLFRIPYFKDEIKELKKIIKSVS